MEISGAIAYFLLLGGAFAVAVGLYFGLRAIKLI
ncbi:cytochrome b6-f complex subunit PetL [Trichocoleus sp. DQ-A2]|nr:MULTISPECIES: cytochrome b6-f complex subunit PetL [unclassified Coleofasciculus]